MNYIYNTIYNLFSSGNVPADEITREQRGEEGGGEEEDLVDAIAQLRLRGQNPPLPTEIQAHILSYLPNEDLRTSGLFLNRALSCESKRLLASKRWLNFPRLNLSHLIEIFDRWERPQSLCFNNATQDKAKVIQFLRSIDSAAHQIKRLDIQKVQLAINELKEIAFLLPNLTHIHLQNPALIKCLFSTQKADSLFEEREKGKLDSANLPLFNQVKNNSYLNVALAALRANGDAWDYLPIEVRGNFEFMLQAIDVNVRALIRLSPNLKNDPEFMLKAIQIAKRRINSPIQFASVDLVKDREFMLKVLEIDPSAVSHASDTLKNDFEFMLEAIEFEESNFRYASNQLKDNSEFMLQVIQFTGRAIYEASDRLKDNANFMLQAVQSTTLAYDQLSFRLKNNSKFMLKADIFRKSPSRGDFMRMG